MSDKINKNMSMIKVIQIRKDDHQNTLYYLDEYPFFIRSNITEISNVLFDTIMPKIALESSTAELIRRYNHPQIEDTYLVIYTHDTTTIFAICSRKINYSRLCEMLRTLAPITPVNPAKPKEETEFVANFISHYVVEEDKFKKIHTQIDETKAVLMESMDKLLDRGQKLDEMLIKSAELSKSSKMFLTRTKKMNKCCVIL